MIGLLFFIFESSGSKIVPNSNLVEKVKKSHYSLGPNYLFIKIKEIKIHVGGQQRDFTYCTVQVDIVITHIGIIVIFPFLEKNIYNKFQLNGLHR